MHFDEAEMKMIFTLQLFMNVSLFSRDPPLQQNLTLLVGQSRLGLNFERDTIFLDSILNEIKTFFSQLYFLTFLSALMSSFLENDLNHLTLW